MAVDKNTEPTHESQASNSLQVPGEEEGSGSQLTTATTRSRWATRKMTVKSSRSKRLSILNRMQHRRAVSGASEKSTASGPRTSEHGANDDGESEGEEEEEEETSQRTLFFNQPLPDEFVDEEGHPLYTYPRNKIRTAKYTPLSFIPKNLWFQFHNVANIFFLFTDILVVSIPFPAYLKLLF